MGNESISRARERRRHLNVEIHAVWSGLTFRRPLNVACECGEWDCNESFNIDPDEFTAVLARGELVLAAAHREAVERRTPEESLDLAADIVNQLNARHRATYDAAGAPRHDPPQAVPALASR